MAISRSDRAKQFMAFDALKGLREAYKEKETEYDERIDLSEEMNKELEEIILNSCIYEPIEIKYYKFRKYIVVRGVITKKDYINKKIYLNKDIEINMYDIAYIRRI